MTDIQKKEKRIELENLYEQETDTVLVRYAQEKDREALITLWEQTFLDSRKYIEQFLERNASFCRIIVCETERKQKLTEGAVNGSGKIWKDCSKTIVSACYLLSVSYRALDGTEKSAWYLYAAATLSQCRGRGFMERILQFIKEKIEEPVLLVPAQKGLISYYERQGFFVWLTECVEMIERKCPKQTKISRIRSEQLQKEKQADKEILIRDRQRQQVQILDCPPEKYIAYRNKLLCFSGSVRWSEHFLDYICYENGLWNDGTQKCVLCGEESYIVLYQTEKDTLWIKEALPRTKDKAWLDALLHETGCMRAVIVWQPTVMCNRNFYGMTRKEMQENGYFNLTMG